MDSSDCTQVENPLNVNAADSVKTVNIVSRLPELAKSHPHLLAAAIQSAGAGANDFDYSEVTFEQLEALSNDAARGLIKQDIGQGVKTVLMVTPSIEFFVLTFALMKVGAIPVLIDPGMGIKNLKGCIAEVKPTAFIGVLKAQIARVILGWGRESIRSIVTVSQNPIGKIFSGVDYKGLLKEGAPTSQEPVQIIESRSQDLAAILFTSGSTGAPKGVEYTHGMFEEQVRILRDVYHIDSGESDLATFPLFSLFGPALGMASIVPDMDASKPITVNPDNLIAAVNQYQCTNMFVSPALIEKVGQYAETNRSKINFNSVRRVISAGAPARHDSIKRFCQLLPTHTQLLPSYGATESLPVSKIESRELLDTQQLTDEGRGVCVGYPVEGLDVRIITITDDALTEWSDEYLATGQEVGEIVVKGPVVSRHYFQRPDAEHVSKILCGDDASFFHRMGDLGYFDDLGRLWMCGRKGHRVMTDSGDLYSIPCERIFDTHAMVNRSALVGVKMAGSIAQTPVICIELLPSFKRVNQSLLRTELLAIAKEHALTSSIQHILFHPKFPVDVRHNAKIFREKLAVWAQKKMARQFDVEGSHS